MPTHAGMIWAVFKRNFFAYFINPTGYVFITVFILLGAMAAFWPDAFFMSNLANLDQLNAFYPLLLLFFVPALTMNVWAEERKQGTDELLFTLPGRDADIVIGKYLAVLGIYTVAVLFSLSHVGVLMWLGEPDLGLMFVTYLGYWLAGAALLAVGMVASLLTANATVAFILGAVFCAVFVTVGFGGRLVGGPIESLARQLDLGRHFGPFGDGVITLSGLFYFAAVTAIMLGVNVVLVGRRHFLGGEGAWAHTTHLAARVGAVAVMAVALGVMISRTGLAADGSAERVHTLQPQTRALIDRIPDDRPVMIQAFLSKEVPEALVQTHKNLRNLLGRFDAVGGDRIRLAIHETEPFTETATMAATNYGIAPRKIVAVEASQRSAVDVFLGLVFTSGPEEFVIPFFDPGLPVEYELARSVRVVSQEQRRRLGVVATDAKLFGGFDFQTMARSSDWSFVAELRKQYDVEQIAPGGPYPDDIDALLVVMPSSLSEPEMDALGEAIRAGTPTLMFDDPLPMFNPQLSPRLPKDAGRNPFTSQGRPPAPPKGDFDGLLAAIGLQWSRDGIVWSGANPHPGIADAAPEIVFVCDSADNAAPFNPDSEISAGLQEVVLVYAGFVRPAPGADASFSYTPLLTSGTISGSTDWGALIRNDFFGMQLVPNPRRFQTPGAHVHAMHVRGGAAAPAEGDSADEGDAGGASGGDGGGDSGDDAGGARPIDVIFVSDSDMVSETFFNLRRQGFEGLNFDNVTFALNCIDVLAGDESFVALRKHRPRHRTLTRVEELSQAYTEQRRAETEAAEARAADLLAQAQERLTAKVEELQARTDVDQQTKAIMLRKLEDVENRRLEVVTSTVEQEKELSIAKARAEMNTAITGIQLAIRIGATFLPAIPPLILAIVLFAYRHQREKLGTSERQLLRA